MVKYTINNEQAGDRLDIFLTRQLSISRSQLAKQIRAGACAVNGQNKSAHYLLRLGDQITVGKLTVNQPLSRAAAIDLSSEVIIVGQSRDWLVVNKPAGMITHYPAGKNNPAAPSLADWLVKNYPAAARVGDDMARPGIVHRLDKAVSGLLALALNQNSFADLKKQFQKRQVQKKYLALVYGRVLADEGLINFPLQRSTSGKKQAARPVGQGGRPALTGFRVKQRLINYTLLEVDLFTGRSHQIRAHLAAYGHPVVGDVIYSTANNRRQNNKLNLNRLFLASVFLSFTDLNGQRQTFTIDLSPPLTALLSQLK